MCVNLASTLKEKDVKTERERETEGDHLQGKRPREEKMR